MSILIKGMKMPKSCGSCWLSKMRDSSLGGILDCKIIGTVGSSFEDKYDILNNRHPNCPIVEILEDDPKRIYAIRKDALRQFVGYLADVNTSKDIGEYIGIPESLVRMLLLDLGMEAKGENTNKS